MAVTEDQLSRWKQPPSGSELQRAESIAKKIYSVLKPSFGQSLKLYLQGSYKNRTNIKAESDIDIVCENERTYFYDDTQLNSYEKALHDLKSDSTYKFSQYKRDVYDLLVSSFNKENVKWSNKCIIVENQSGSSHADVLPCFTYKILKSSETSYVEGIKFFSDKGERIINYPHVHYNNGCIKHDETKKMFKKVVRIIKNVNSRLISQNQVPSHFIECLVFNVSKNSFFGSTYTEIIKKVLLEIYQDMDNPLVSRTYKEVDKIQSLFGKNYTTPQAKLFIERVWNYTFR